MSVARTLKRNQLRNQIVTDKNSPKFGKPMGNKLMGRVWQHYVRQTAAINEKYEAKIEEAVAMKSPEKSLKAVAAAKAFRTVNLNALERMIFKG